jgi:hypothetical protein
MRSTVKPSPSVKLRDDKAALVPGKFLQYSPIFAFNAGAYLSGAIYGAP